MRAALTEEKVPERVPVERKQVERAAVRNHKDPYRHGYRDRLPAEMGSTPSTSSSSMSLTASFPSSSKYR